MWLNAGSARRTTDIEARFKGMPMGGMAIRLASGANALDTGDRVKAKMEELSKYFPHGMKVVYPTIQPRLSRYPSKRW